MDLIRTTTKKIIAGVSVATTMVLGVLVYPIDASMEYTAYEIRTFAVIYDYEIEQMSSAKLQDITISANGTNLYEKLNNQIRQRKPTEPIIVNNELLSPEDYELLREDLMNRVEKSNLLKELIL